MNITINNSQKATVKISPSFAGKILVLKDAPSWTVVSGSSTITPEADGLSATIVSGNPGASTFRVETNTPDLGQASDTCVVDVTDANAERFGNRSSIYSGTNPSPGRRRFSSENPGFDQFGNRLSTHSGTIPSEGRQFPVEGPVHVDAQGRYVDQNGNVLDGGQYTVDAATGQVVRVNAPASVDSDGRFIEGARYTDALGRSMGGPVHTDSAGRTVDEGGRIVDGPGRLVHDPVYQDRSGRYVDGHGRYVDSAGHVVERSNFPLPIAVGAVHVDNAGRTVDSTGQVILEAGRTVDASGRYVDEFVTGARVHTRSGRANQIGHGVTATGNYNLGLSVVSIAQK